MKTTLLSLSSATFFLALMSGCAVQAADEGTPNETKDAVPAVQAGSAHAEDYNAYAACMDNCTGAGDPATGSPSLPDWGSQTLDCDQECAWHLSPTGGHAGKTRFPKLRTY